MTKTKLVAFCAHGGCHVNFEACSMDLGVLGKYHFSIAWLESGESVRESHGLFRLIRLLHFSLFLDSLSSVISWCKQQHSSLVHVQVTEQLWATRKHTSLQNKHTVDIPIQWRTCARWQLLTTSLVHTLATVFKGDVLVYMYLLNPSLTVGNYRVRYTDIHR